MGLTFPRNIFMELFISNSWVEITEFIRQHNNISISRGRGGEQGAVAPGTLDCVLDNESGNFTPSNAMSPYYKKVTRGTPLRFGLNIVEDTFTRVVSNGWGTADTGEAWTTNAGAGGTVQGSDWNVASGVATHSVPTTAAYRYSTLDTVTYRDIEVTATTTVAITNITGGDIEPCNILLRRSGSTYYMIRVAINLAEVLTITIHSVVAGVSTELTTPVTVSGLIDSVSNKVIRVKAQCEGQTIRAKVYTPGAEPVDWHVMVNSTAIPAAGAVGIRSGVGSGNTNTKPIIFSNDNFEVRNLRFSGELVEVKPRWSVDHKDKWAELTASTVLRRLQQGKTPVKSTLRRAYLADNINFPIQYWPCEEGEDAKQLQSAIDDRHISISGRPQFAQFREFMSSSPLPRLNGSIWTGFVAPYTATGEAQLRFLLAVPKDGGGIADSTPVADFYCTGSLQIFRILYRTGGGLSLNVYNNTGALVGAPGGSIALDINGALARVSLELTQNGGNVDWGLSRYDVTTDVFGGASASVAGTFVLPERVIINPAGSLNDTALGHIVVQSEITSINELQSEYNAWRGDSAISRAQRLCLENGISELAYIGLSVAHRMGPQIPTVLYELFQECQEVIQGTLYDSRFIGNTMVLRTVNTIYAQDSRLTLDYSNNEIAPLLQPDADDKPAKNDVTAKRLVGGEYRVSRETGPLNAQDPGTIEGAIGRYDQQVPVNVKEELQLVSVASWALHLGTTDVERVPKVTVNMRELNTTLQASILDLDIDDRFTITNLEDVDYYDDFDLILRGMKETYQTGYQHTIQFNCAPYEPYNVAVFDDSDSRWSSQDSTLDSDLTDSATSFTVDVNAGEPWTTTAGMFPLDIMIGGERIRISSIAAPSAATPPLTQVFTVDTDGRSINGVVKEHSAGDAVTLAPPVYFGR
jgi:hypothetical protein